MKPLSGKRIVVCGKGGCGKSSIVAMMAHILNGKKYNVIVLDGDASNPEGVARLALGITNDIEPLIEFFGGRDKVECPVDDPSPLTRKDDKTPITKKHIDMEEIPQGYYNRRDNLTLMQVGKIQNPYEGCDGPMSKITRDFIVKGDNVMLIDVEAGIEHFGRGIEENIDIVLVVVDSTYESIAIAERIKKICNLMKIDKMWSLLNRFHSDESKNMVVKELDKKGIKVLGVVDYDYNVLKAGLQGTMIGSCNASEEVGKAINWLESIVSGLN